MANVIVVCVKSSAVKQISNCMCSSKHNKANKITETKITWKNQIKLHEMEPGFLNDTSLDAKMEIRKLITEWENVYYKNVGNRQTLSSARVMLKTAVLQIRSIEKAIRVFDTQFEPICKLHEIFYELYIIHEALRFLISDEMKTNTYMCNYEAFVTAIIDAIVKE